MTIDQYASDLVSAVHLLEQPARYLAQFEATGQSEEGTGTEEEGEKVRRWLESPSPSLWPDVQSPSPSVRLACRWAEIRPTPNN
jgi:hypothetical protein